MCWQVEEIESENAEKAQSENKISSSRNVMRPTAHVAATTIPPHLTRGRSGQCS